MSGRKWWQRGKKQAPRTEAKQLPLGANNSLGKFLIFGYTGGGTPSGALALYNDSTAVSVPVNIVASAFASLTPVLEMEDGRTIDKHPVLELLRVPSPFYDEMLFAETLAAHYLITGEAEVVALGAITRPPLELQPISPANVSIIEGQGGTASAINISGNTLAGSYSLDLKKGQARYVDGTLREIKQIRGFSTSGNSLLRGQSPLVSAAAEARQHILGTSHNVSLLEKGGRVSMVFNFEEDMEPEDFEATKQRVREQYGGAENAGQIGVTAGNKMTVHELGTNNKDMDFAKLQRMAREAVAMQYKVPLVLMSTDAATFNNFKEAKLALYDDAVLPLADKLYAGLSSLLLPRYGLDPSKVRITYDMDSITALATRRNEELKLRRELNLETDNELRAMIGRESVTGGDVLRAPANLIPIATDLFTDTPTVVRDTPLKE